MAENALEKEALDRLKDCRAQKAMFERDIREAYFFTAPQRCRDVSSQTSPTQTKPEDPAELQTSLGMEVAQDFATEMVNTFIPQAIEWAQQKPGVDLDEDAWDEVEEDVTAQSTTIHEAIKASNFYAAAALTFFPDLPVGTCAMWIDDLRPAEPIVCQPIPLRELEINVGPFGEVDDRFVVRHTRHKHVKALLPNVPLPAEIEKKIKDKPNERCKVQWGFWRKWDRTDDVVWQGVILVGNKKVWDGEFVGEGSCPLIVGRFDPDTMYAFGTGPTIKSLPELRRLDETEALKIENADFQIHPPFSYPDDGITNFSGGIEPGMGYPSRPGSGRDFVKLSFEGNVDFAEFETAKIEERIRRLHFVDFPEQLGKTPPTAEQWLDELQRTKKRIGTPGAIFWREFPAQVFLRFKFLLEKRGKIEPVKVNGKVLSLVPYDPTEVAQDQQDAMIASRLLEMARNYFPEISQVAIDPLETLSNLKKKLRDKVVKIRSQDEMKQAVETVGSMIGPGGGAPPGAPTA
ncbi:MAG TPA: portal protein [Microvirga sp.]|nr:portal protein [Microvirga sp.]